jgi:ferredoxin-NADP reductase
MAGTALRRRLDSPGPSPGRSPWRTARLVDAVSETASARTLRFEVDDWAGHLAGQHVDVRLTAPDGYTAQRSYSIAAPANGSVVELTVQLMVDGEVSPFLVNELAIGDDLELRGPLGGWFVWRPEQPEPALLVAGGSGVAPLMAMVRARRQARRHTPFRLLYSVRTPADVFYAAELQRAPDAAEQLTLLYTRAAPEGTARPAHRIAAADLDSYGFPASETPTCYVCGPTPFVEIVADLLVAAGHDPAHIRTERFGATGG